MPFLFLFRSVFVEFFSISSHVLIHTFKFRVRSPLVIRRATRFSFDRVKLVSMALSAPHSGSVARWRAAILIFRYFNAKFLYFFSLSDFIYNFFSFSSVHTHRDCRTICCFSLSLAHDTCAHSSATTPLFR